MNYLRKYGLLVVISLALLVAVFSANGVISTYAENAERDIVSSSSSAQSLHGMISKDKAAFGKSAPAQSFSEESRLADQQAAEKLLRERLLFTPAADFQVSDVATDDLPDFFAKRLRSMRTSLNTTFWHARELRGKGRGSVGVNFAPEGTLSRPMISARLWQLDVLRRCFELAVRYRIARVTSFGFDNGELAEIANVAPSARALSVTLRSDEERRFDRGSGGGEGFITESVEDPFLIVYQPLSITFFANYVEATNFLSELAREDGESGQGRPVFPVSWKMERNAADTRGNASYKVTAKLVAFSELSGSDLDIEVLDAILPKEDFFDGARR